MAIEDQRPQVRLIFTLFHNGFVSPLLANSLLAVRICELILLVVGLAAVSQQMALIHAFSGLDRQATLKRVRDECLLKLLPLAVHFGYVLASDANSIEVYGASSSPH